MYRYSLILPFKITECLNCPFRHEELMFEYVQTTDKINGTTMLQRRKCTCTLNDNPIDFNIQVEGYQSLCPLKGKIEEVE